MPKQAAPRTAGKPATSVRMLAAYFDASAGYSTGADGSSGSATLQVGSWGRQP